MSTFAHCVYPNAIAVTVTPRKKWALPLALNLDGLSVKTKFFFQIVVYTINQKFHYAQKTWGPLESGASDYY